MEKKYTFIGRTTHREDSGGFEEWNFEINDNTFLFVGDIRKPGLVISHINDENTNDICKACFIDIFDVKDNGTNEPVVNYINPSVLDSTLLENIAENVIDLLLNVIKPARAFCYIVFLDKTKNSFFYEKILEQICMPVDKGIKKKIIATLNEDNKNLIKEGLLSCYVGELKN